MADLVGDGAAQDPPEDELDGRRLEQRVTSSVSTPRLYHPPGNAFASSAVGP